MNDTKITDFPRSCSYVHSTCIYSLLVLMSTDVESNVVIKETVKNQSGNFSETIFSKRLKFCMLSVCAHKFQHTN